MRNIYLLLACHLFTYSAVTAADKYWVGPSGGNWNNDLNWSFTSGGAGGAGGPGVGDAVIFNGTALVKLDVSPTIYSLRTTFASANVTLYTDASNSITILNNLRVEPFSFLKDSTSANVSFNLIFNTATQATGDIFGQWSFEGGVPLNSGNTGATFTAGAGSLVTVASIFPFNPGQGGSLVFKKNTGNIVSTVSTLKFSYNSYYILENNLNASIPAASWAKDSLQVPGYNGILGAPSSTIQINGNMVQLQYLAGAITFGRMKIDLQGLSSDASLALPDGAKIRGNLEIVNTNNHTLTLLASTGAASSVQVEIGTTDAGSLFGGELVISGNTTKVALAKATAAAPSSSYRLLVHKSYTQTGGNFSIQDFDNASGNSTLSIKNNFTQTGGTFITNSTSTNRSAKFMVVMEDPNFISGPSGYFVSLRSINVSSGTIDNSRHKVTLKVDHNVYNISGFETLSNGVVLQSPLEVGRLELNRGPLTTTTANILTVNDPSVDAVTVGNTGKSYVNGPIRRATNAAQSYLFPTGKGTTIVSSYNFDSLYIVPVSTAASVYQAEFFNVPFPDLSVVAPLKGVSNSQYWEVAKISGADAQVKLALNSTVSGAASSDGIIASRYVNGHWVSEHSTVLTPGTASSGIVVSKPVATFGPFTFGYANPGSLPSSGTTGLTYKYYQGSFNMLPDFNSLTPVQTGASANVDINVRPAGVTDGYAFVWEGTINIPTPGVYTFETISDDGSKLYFNMPYSVNGTALVNNDGAHAAKSEAGSVNVTAAGSYPLTITFFESTGGEAMQVYWSGPGIPRQLVPDAAFKPATPSTYGLSYKFFQGNYTSLPDFSMLTPVKTGTSSNVDIGVRPAGTDEYFAFIWEGYIHLPLAGTYTFETISDDGSKLYFNTPYNVNATALVNNDGLHAAQSVTGSVTVAAAGTYPIAITFFENYGGESMQVYWSGPGIPRQLIPNSAFTSGAAVPPPASGLGYKYYEGDFSTLPDFTALTPVKTGATSNIDLGVRTQGLNDHYAFMWQGYINILSPGNYTFETISDDGSKVYFNTPYSFNGSSLVNNDGLHAPVSATGTVNVPAAGLYPITITFFEKDGGETMQLYWTGPGISRQLIPDAAFSTSNSISNTATYFSNKEEASGTTAELVNNSIKIYPNPFSDEFTINYHHSGSNKEKVNIGLYDLKGRLMYTYQPGNLLPGNNRWLLNFAGENLAEGVYVARLNINGIPSKTIKLYKTRK